jgi:hypothetical protein
MACVRQIGLLRERRDHLALTSAGHGERQRRPPSILARAMDPSTSVLQRAHWRHVPRCVYSKLDIAFWA